MSARKMVFRKTRRRTACHEGRWRSFKKCTHVCARWIACLRDDVLATFFGGGEASRNVEGLELRTTYATCLLHVWRSTCCGVFMATCAESCLSQRVGMCFFSMRHLFVVHALLFFGTVASSGRLGQAWFSVVNSDEIGTHACEKL